ncbi:MAG: beta-galactosidase [Lentisphaeria bacterium]|nr:beta-galactosidase [Lentisphaeria bacterium]
MAGTVEIRGGEILIDGAGTQILSGAMHYFRIHPEYWRDRLVKLRRCGLNTVETYLAWNFHEPRRGEFDFSGWRDFTAFLKIAQEEKLHAIVRPGPYICSEWDLGGLPAWLLNEPGLRLRCSNRPYLEAVRSYMSRVLGLLKPLQHTEGGPVIAMQVENEYGSYGNDRAYMEFVRGCFDEAGITVPLFTSDGETPGGSGFEAGMLPGVLATANFRNHPAKRLPALEQLRPGEPKFVMELWDGGAHHWGKMYPRHEAEGVRRDVREILENGFHMNLYMFHGGSNFGFMNGGNIYDGRYLPMLSTYDVDAALSEEGDPAPKYFAIRDEIRKLRPELPAGEPAVLEKRAYGEIPLTSSALLLGSLPRLSRPVRSAAPEPMERFGQNYGYILYRTRSAQPGIFQLTLDGLKDRAVVMVNGAVAGVVYRNDPQPVCTVSVPEEGGTLDILVENMGRVNFGPDMELELKGVRGVRRGGQFLFGWEIFPLEFDRAPEPEWRDGVPEEGCGPLFLRGFLEISGDPCDTFLAVPRGTRGCVFVNGFNLGRYWEVGPQRTLYVPAPLLRTGRNEFIVFDLQGAAGLRLISQDRRDFGPAFTMQI